MIKVFDLDTDQFLPSPFVDLQAQVNNIQDRGLMDIELPPDFGPDNPYMYAFYVVDPPGTAGGSGNAGPDGAGNRFAYVVRFEADAAANYTTAIAGSEEILLGGAGQTLADISGGGALDFTLPQYSGLPSSEVDPNTGEYIDDYIKVDSRSHAGGSLEFGPDGALYVSTGDGTSYNYADPRSPDVQDLDSLSGKILRVDPDTGDGLSDNPFWESGLSLDSNRAKVYQLGLRNPFAMAFDENGQLFMSNTGWNSWESIFSGGPGANFGWPFYEGGDNGVLLETPVYRDFPEAGAFYQAVDDEDITIIPSFRAFAHADSAPGYQVGAIVGADSVYHGSVYPSGIENDFFFADVNQREVFAVDIYGRDVKFLYRMPVGSVPVHFKEGPDGYIYYADLTQGVVGRYLIEGGPFVAPVVTGIAVDTGAPGDGITSDNTLIINGTAEANAAVEVFLGAASSRDDHGQWFGRLVVRSHRDRSRRRRLSDHRSGDGWCRRFTALRCV